LRKITTYVSLLQETEASVLSPKGQAYCKTIVDSAGRMRNLISDLISYSVTDVKERKFALTDLNDLLKEVKSELEPLLLEKNGKLDVKPLCAVSINVSQFRQVFVNLISNAIKFSKPGTTPEITIGSKQIHWQDLQDEVPPVILGAALHKDDYCRIQVKDNGIGFDPKYSDKIFEVFQRLHTKETFQGTGIGLAIVKKIVEHHHGFITATSVPDEGATFSIYLPADFN
jgi:signal transduction histidine kinase